MTTLAITDFKLGLDLRKTNLTAEPGSLQQLDNCVITPGAEIMKRKAFVPVFALPPGKTRGLAGTDNNTFGMPELHVWSQGYATPVATQIGSIGTNPACAVFQHNLKLSADEKPTTALSAIYGTQNYTGFYFVSGAALNAAGNGQILRNWWAGNPVANYTGYDPIVNQQKMYRAWGSILYFSGVGDPSDTNPLNPGGTGPNTVHPGAGFIDCSGIDSAAQWAIGLENYYKQTALFFRHVTLMFQLDPDPSQNVLQQVLRIGAVSPGSIRQYGSGDVLFLADDGVRSLRVQNISLAAGVQDVGSPIDNLIRPALANKYPVYYGAQAVVEPYTGRYWVAIDNVIYVLSYWPQAKITAWSTFTLPWVVEEMAVAGNVVYIRAQDTIYAYGGLDNQTYDTSVATVRTPLMSADTPTVRKKAISISAMVRGNWQLGVCMDPDNPTVFETAANLSKTTYAQEQFPFAGYASHIGFKLTSSDASAAMVGQLEARFEKGREM